MQLDLNFSSRSSPLRTINLRALQEHVVIVPDRVSDTPFE